MPSREEIKAEIHRTLTLLHRDPILLGVIEAWCAGADDAEVVADLRNWNEAKAMELEEWLPTLTGKDHEAVETKLRQFRKAA